MRLWLLQRWEVGIAKDSFGWDDRGLFFGSVYLSTEADYRQLQAAREKCVAPKPNPSSFNTTSKAPSPSFGPRIPTTSPCWTFISPPFRPKGLIRISPSDPRNKNEKYSSAWM